MIIVNANNIRTKRTFNFSITCNYCLSDKVIIKIMGAEEREEVGEVIFTCQECGEEDIADTDDVEPVQRLPARPILFFQSDVPPGWKPDYADEITVYDSSQRIPILGVDLGVEITEENFWREVNKEIKSIIKEIKSIIITHPRR